MNLKLTGLGAEPRKVLMLGGLLVLAVFCYFYFGSSSGPGPSSTPAASRPAASAPVAAVPAPTVTRTVDRLRGPRGKAAADVLQFRPSLKPKPDAQLDRASIDPTLRLDLLEKLQNVKVTGVSRSLFEYTSGPPPTQLAKNIPEPKPIKVSKFVGPVQPTPPPKPVAAVKPPPPPIPLKFYGFIAPAKSGVKRAFFLDGEDIIVGSEGQLVKNRYKIVRIGVNSAVVEDTQFEHHQQTLPLVEEQTG